MKDHHVGLIEQFFSRNNRKIKFLCSHKSYLEPVATHVSGSSTYMGRKYYDFEHPQAPKVSTSIQDAKTSWNCPEFMNHEITEINDWNQCHGKLCPSWQHYPHQKQFWHFWCWNCLWDSPLLESPTIPSLVNATTRRLILQIPYFPSPKCKVLFFKKRFSIHFTAMCYCVLHFILSL